MITSEVGETSPPITDSPTGAPSQGSAVSCYDPMREAFNSFVEWQVNERGSVQSVTSCRWLHYAHGCFSVRPWLREYART